LHELELVQDFLSFSAELYEEGRVGLLVALALYVEKGERGRVGGRSLIVWRRRGH